MSERQLPYALIVLGLVLVLASLLVDVVDLGSEGFGRYQIAGVILGVIVAGVGAYLGFIRQKPVV